MKIEEKKGIEYIRVPKKDQRENKPKSAVQSRCIYRFCTRSNKYQQYHYLLHDLLFAFLFLPKNWYR